MTKQTRVPTNPGTMSDLSRIYNNDLTDEEIENLLEDAGGDDQEAIRAQKRLRSMYEERNDE